MSAYGHSPGDILKPHLQVRISLNKRWYVSEMWEALCELHGVGEYLQVCVVAFHKLEPDLKRWHTMCLRSYTRKKNYRDSQKAAADVFVECALLSVRAIPSAVL